MKIAICIDYDNLEETQKHSGILSVVTSVLQKMHFDSLPSNSICHIRLYGGWFEGSSMSQLSQAVSVKIQQEFPGIIRLIDTKGRTSAIQASAELAMSLLEEPGFHLFDTYRRKAHPRNIRIETQANIGCSTQGCPIPIVQKLLRTGTCPTNGCTTGNKKLLYRNEQKIVDTMLTCDLLYLSQQQYNEILLISQDDDFLPPIRSIILRGSKIIRVHPKFSAHRTPINIAGTILPELEV